MKKRVEEKLSEARALLHEAEAKAENGNIAYQLAALSMQSHVAELEQTVALEAVTPVHEVIDFRLFASSLSSGSAPLGFVATAADEIKSMIGHAALRLSQGGIRRKRVPKELYETLDLRLAGVLHGSSRLVVTSAAHRDLFDGGLAKESLDRIFKVLQTEGQGREFLEAITDLGPSSARRLRDFLELLKAYSAEIELTWKYAGNVVCVWKGKKASIDSVAASLAVTEVNEQDEIEVNGVIELLSKRERLHIRQQDGTVLRILFAKNLLAEVSLLHLDQKVSLLCQATETLNPLTNEVSVFYELIKING